MAAYAGIRIKICISGQELQVFSDNKVIKVFPVSTSKYGIGNKAGSNKTPLGLHRVCGKPASHGCIRMKNRDIIKLFGRVHKGAMVEIV